MRLRSYFVVCGLLGCGSSVVTKPGDPMCDEVEQCIENPRPHCMRDTCARCLAGQTCPTPARCPSGLGCESGPDNVVYACPGADDERCRWLPPSLATSALIDGFDTRTMGLTIDETSLRFTWSIPENALYVSCAIFTCNPIVEDRVEVTDSDTDPSGNPLRVIANAEACILELRTSDDSRSSVVMSGSMTRTLGATCAAEGTMSPIVSVLAGACWAYDSYHIVAASELIPIQPASLSMNPRIPVDASCGIEDAACYDSAHRFFGACVNHECQPRCRTPIDCEHAVRSLFGISSETCGWRCREVPGSVAGVCEPL